MDNLTKTKQELASRHFIQLKNLIKQQGLLFLEIGRTLKIFRDEKYYQVMGYDTWSDFIVSGEIGIKHSTIYTYIGIYEIFVMRYGIDLDMLADIPYDKLSMALPKARLLEKKEDVEDLVFRVKELSRSDLAIEFGDVVENGRLKTRLVKAFVCDKCDKLIIDVDKRDICNCVIDNNIKKI